MKYPRLCKTIEHLVDTGAVDGRTRLVKLVYLSDKKWFETKGSNYTEARYYRWNHGPFAREILAAVEWMDGVELIEKEHYGGQGVFYTYSPGERTRLHDVQLDPEFRGIVDHVVGTWRTASLQSLLAHVYEQQDFERARFGDNLLARD